LRKQFDLMLRMRDRQDDMNKAILAIRDLSGHCKRSKSALVRMNRQNVVTAAADLRKKSARSRKNSSR